MAEKRLVNFQELSKDPLYGYELERIERLLEFIPIFEQEGYVYYTDSGESYIYYRYSPESQTFLNEIYDPYWFDHTDGLTWKSRNGDTAFSPEFFKTATLWDLLGSFCYMIVSDRFCTGYLAEALKSGLVFDIIKETQKRINEIDL